METHYDLKDSIELIMALNVTGSDNSQPWLSKDITNAPRQIKITSGQNHIAFLSMNSKWQPKYTKKTQDHMAHMHPVLLEPSISNVRNDKQYNASAVFSAINCVNLQNKNKSCKSDAKMV
jgi:hypothetical protein